MRIDKELIYLTHESGTKFYEVALFSCPTTKRFVTVRRQGKMSGAAGGGEVMIGTFDSPTTARRDMNTIIASKTKRGYSTDHFNHGLRSGIDEFEHDMIGTAMHSHYGNGTVDAVFAKLGIFGADDRNEEDAEVAFAALPTEKPEPQRSADWNSW